MKKISGRCQKVKIFNIRCATMKSTKESSGCCRGFDSVKSSVAGGDICRRDWRGTPIIEVCRRNKMLRRLVCMAVMLVVMATMSLSFAATGYVENGCWNGDDNYPVIAHYGQLEKWHFGIRDSA